MTRLPPETHPTTIPSFNTGNRGKGLPLKWRIFHWTVWPGVGAAVFGLMIVTEVL